MSIQKGNEIDAMISGNLPKIIFIKSDGREEIVEQISRKLGIQHTDVIRFFSSEGVEKLRNDLKLLNISASSSFKLLALLDGESINDEQANTLLKTLEEPPSYAKIILFSQSINRILPTIRSRCQKVFIGDKDSDFKGDLLSLFDKKDFISMSQYLKDLDNNEIPERISSMLAQMKKRGLNDNTSELYKRVAQSLIKINYTNVNRKLILENIFIWWKTQKT